MYCSKCGRELKDGAIFCHHCGAAVLKGQHPASLKWNEVADLLADGSFGFAKVLLWILGGGMALACGCTATGMLVTACYLLYHFSKGLSVMTPVFIMEAFSVTSVDGIWLLLTGLAAAFVAILLAMAAFALVKGISVIDSRNHESIIPNFT